MRRRRAGELRWLRWPLAVGWLQVLLRWLFKGRRRRAVLCLCRDNRGSKARPRARLSVVVLLFLLRMRALQGCGREWGSHSGRREKPAGAAGHAACRGACRTAAANPANDRPERKQVQCQCGHRLVSSFAGKEGGKSGGNWERKQVCGSSKMRRRRSARRTSRAIHFGSHSDSTVGSYQAVESSLQLTENKPSSIPHLLKTSLRDPVDSSRSNRARISSFISPDSWDTCSTQDIYPSTNNSGHRPRFRTICQVNQLTPIGGHPAGVEIVKSRVPNAA